MFPSCSFTDSTVPYEETVCLAVCVEFVYSLLFIYVCLLILMYTWCAVRKSRTRQPTMTVERWPGHEVRWLLALALGLSNCADWADGLISSRQVTFTRPFSSWNALVALVATLSSCIYYDRAEVWRRPLLLSWTLPYWLAVCAAAIGKSALLPTQSFIFGVQLVQAITCAGLLATDGFVVAQALFACFKVGQSITSRKPNLTSQSSDSVFTADAESGPVNNEDRSQQYCYMYPWSNFLSKASFFWLGPLLVKGYFNPLELEHLGPLPEAELSRTRQEILQKYMDDRLARGKQLNLWHCYWSLSWPMIILGGILKLLGDCVGYISPLGIRVIVNYVNNCADQAEPADGHSYLGVAEFFSNGFVMAFVVFISALCQGALSQASSHVLCMEGIRLKTSLQAMVYSKCLKLPSWGVDENHEGQPRSEENGDDLKVEPGTLSNLLTEDCSNVMFLICLCHYVWAIPLKIAVLMYLLYRELSTGAVIASLLCLIIMIPLQFILGKQISTSNRETMKVTDQRLQLTHEWLSNMKLLRLYAWELFGKERVEKLRSKELSLLWNYSLHWAWATFLTQASTVLLTSLTFVLVPFFQEGNRPAAANAFTGLALMNQFTVPLFILPVIVPELLAAKNSTARLARFLTQSEVKERQQRNLLRGSSTHHAVSSLTTAGSVTLENIAEDEEPPSDPAEIVVKVDKASFAWQCSDSDQSSESSGCVLHDIDLEIPRGTLTVVIGSVGSGKSSLISALLGELVLKHGSLTWSRAFGSTVGFVSQKPWLLHASLKDNILFGSSVNEKRYSKVISACCLEQDISSFPEQESTVILSGGVNLSGGQKVRVALARALYSRAPTVLLDDPFAALDASVADHVFHHAIQNALVRQGRTVVLTTHHVTYAKMANHVVLMENGRIVAQGSPKRITEQRPSIFEPVPSARTAKDRWHLLKIMAKTNSVFNAVRQKQADLEAARSRKWKRRSSRLNALSRHMSHDIPLLTDEIVLEESEEVHSAQSVSRRSLVSSRRPRKLSSDTSSIAPVPNIRSYSLSLKVTNPLSVFRRQRQALENRMSLQQVSFRPGGGDAENPPRPALRRLLSTPEGTARKSKNRKSSARESFFRSVSYSSSGQGSSVSSTKTLGFKDPSHPAITTRLLSTVSGFSDDTEVEQDSDRGLISDPAAAEEERQYGRVSRRLYWYYMKACGFPMTLAYLISTLGWQASRLLTDFWLRDWTDPMGTRTDTGYNDTAADVNVASDSVTGDYLWTYILLSAISVLAALLSNVLGQGAGNSGRKELHSGLLSSLSSCETHVFEVEPTGRLLNRFSSDMSIIDKKLATTFQRLLQFVLLCLSAVLVNAIISPWTLLLALPIMIVFYALQRFFRTSARELQRLENLTKGPIVSHLTETVCGLPTLRAFGQQKRFLATMYEKTDSNTAAVVVLNCANRWLGLAVDSLGACVLFVATVAALVAHSHQAVSSGLVGLAINYTLLTPIYLQWVVRFWSELEMYFNAVERVLHYSHLKPESQLTSNDQVPPDWPARGELLFDRVSITYDQKTTVVRDFDIQIKAGDKIGICGRTGSGKTTITNALLGLAKIASGRIVIDEVDISIINPRTVRSRLAVVPQEFLLLSGTLRDNLDPEGIFSDEELWSVLEKVHLKDCFSTNKLESEIWENGANLSFGQQQLLSLARAALRPSSLVILDEPSSSLDSETEKVFHQSLKQLFRGRTILMIAHRETSLRECDRLLVMEDGVLLTQGTPADVLSRVPMNRL